MRKAIIASCNQGKIREIEQIVSLSQLELLTYKDFDQWPSVVEAGASYKDNAVVKAKALVKMFNLPALADDSGLEVDVLGGAPGLHSARYAGPQCSAEDNNRKLLKELSNCLGEERTARFRCVAVYLEPTGKMLATEGICEGHIAFKAAGSHGFGYDPLFVPFGYTQTMAELPPELKNKLSHRGKAFGEMKKLLEKLILKRREQ